MDTPECAGCESRELLPTAGQAVVCKKEEVKNGKDVRLQIVRVRRAECFVLLRLLNLKLSVVASFVK